MDLSFTLAKIRDLVVAPSISLRQFQQSSDVPEDLEDPPQVMYNLLLLVRA